MKTAYQRWSAILSGRCPACYKGKAYSGLLSIKDTCSSCGYDLASSDVGDGAAYIGICIVGTLVVLAAVWIEMALMPPLWVHVAVWVPVTLVGTVITLKLAKTWLIHAQYRYRNQKK